MSNILKPIGFVLILGAVGAGAYFLGQASKKPPGSAPVADAVNPPAQPGVIQRVKNFVGVEVAPAGPETAPATPATEPPPPVQAQPTTTAQPRPTVAAPATTTLSAEVVALDGDLVRTKAQYKVRLIGVRTPPKGVYQTDARAALAKLLGDGAVKLQFEGTDRTAAFVWKDGRLLNETMIRQGWSRAGHPRFLTAEAAARSQGVGLWSPEGWMGVNP